jgi:hypothetical protein
MIEFNSTQPATPDTVSHYTSQVGLIGIIQNESVWVSSIRHLNDSAELPYAANLMRVHDQKVMSHAALRSVLRSQKS